ncbi:TetR/AcrR family transcriptional regulator [Mucilaginibacter sp. X4EP1]|uniref:TetR/AcrR family transcriptional regulator n=1 Tax=Mucilaginibacter sp. X4EP1 TaxID=2723092 RepID=UPI00216A0612|nr:TetR/AcrR family transcriptional regulator [Mucilaginibacter sp. X4EP1]MCS3814518.1 AcrR family transcriptional regulator [Mucilaginibacter sp. X4EP1]
MRKIPVRAAIVKTASRLFYQQGYSNTGINQIIAEAGIAKSSLYQHFRSKEELLLAYLEETGLQTMDALSNAAEQGNTPKEKLLAIFDYLEILADDPEFYGCHFLNMVYELPADAVRIREQIKKQKDSIRELFRNILAPVDKEILADEIYTLFEGSLVGNKIHNDLWPIISAKRIVKKLV